MIKNQEENEFIAVRVQDPRVQNEGSWNSYVDFKIFLHTNSKAFTAKTSCVRRRYSEFVWLKKKLQKNAGLVPVPDLPNKSYFSFSSEDFLERRRKGLQGFLDKVLHMTVCLSDSQLHLFLQTQLPLGHIQDCVQGHTPYTVTEAILTYASSNRGWAQEEDTAQEWALTPVPYESMESPVPHLPTLPRVEPLSPVPPTSTDPTLHTREAIADIHDPDTVELQFHQTENPSLAATLEHRCAGAVLEKCSPAEVTSAGDGQGESPLEEETHEEDRQPQTPVEVHRPEGVEEESALVEERPQEEESPAGGAEETTPQAEGVAEPSSHEETCHRDSPEKPVPEPLRHAELTPHDDTPAATGSAEDDAEGPGRLDEGQGRVGETGGREEDSVDAEAVLEAEDTTQETEEGFREEGQAVDGEEEEDEEGMVSQGDGRQNEDPDGRGGGETSRDGSSVEESAAEDSSPEETSQATNGYMETTPDDRHRHADVKVHHDDAPKAKTSRDPSPDRGTAQANNVREIVRFEVGEKEEILYMSNIFPAKTLEQMSSGLEEVNNPEMRDNHLESSGERSTDVVVCSAGY